MSFVASSISWPHIGAVRNSTHILGGAPIVFLGGKVCVMQIFEVRLGVSVSERGTVMRHDGRQSLCRTRRA